MLILTTTGSISDSNRAVQELVVDKTGSYLMFSSTYPLPLLWLQLGWMLLPAGLLMLIDYWLYQSLDKRVCVLAILLVLLLLCCGFYQWRAGF
jgi:hypothetical protein